MYTTTEIDAATVVAALAPELGGLPAITDLDSYAAKVVERGRALVRHDEWLGPTAFVLYYDDQAELFITMVWTHPARRGEGLSKQLLIDVIRRTDKVIALEVHADSPAKVLYDGLGFVEASRQEQMLRMRRDPRIAIMQPYFFPNLGYFHLADAADLFVFYDDVNYIRRGWINRNALLVNGRRWQFSVPVSGGSQNAMIKDVRLAGDPRWSAKFEATLRMCYASAPNVESVTAMVVRTLREAGPGVADLAIASVVAVFDYLDLPFRWTRSAQASPGTSQGGRMERLAGIAREQGFACYVNAPGGRALYSREEFAGHGVRLDFVDSEFRDYPQGGGEFVPGLSIIDVLMWNSPEEVLRHLSTYRLS